MLDETEQKVTYLTSKIYDLSEQNGIDDEEFEEELPSEILIGVPKEESEEESIETSTDEESKLMSQIRNVYKDDELV